MRRPVWLLMHLLSLCGTALVGCAHIDSSRDLNPKASETPLFQVPQNTSITTTPTPPTPYPAVPQPLPPQPAPKVSPASPPSPADGPGAADTTGAATTPAVSPERQTVHQKEDHYGPPSDPAIPTARVATDHAAVKALCCLAENKQADAVLLLQAYSKPNQELLLTLLTVAASLADPAAARTDQRQTTTANVQALEECVDHLRRYAALRLDKVCFCQWIDKFGVYEPLPEGHGFLPGSQVHVYVELRNFTSEQCGHGYETRLASRVKILDGQGKLVPGCEWSFNDRNRPEHSLSLRHDYFINYSLPLPRTMAPGHYKLLLYVEDLPTKRIAEQPMDLVLTTRPLAAN